VVERIPMPTWRFSLKAADFALWSKVLTDLGQVTQPVDENRLVMITR
jgi:hypothetical protein